MLYTWSEDRGFALTAKSELNGSTCPLSCKQQLVTAGTVEPVTVGRMKPVTMMRDTMEGLDSLVLTTVLPVW